MDEAPAATLPETVSEAPADELMERYAIAGLTRSLAQVIAKDFAAGRMMDSGRIREKAVDSLLRHESADVIKLILFRIFESAKPRLAVGCLLLATGIKPIGIASERALATQQHVSPEHVSNGVQEWQQLLGLARVEFQKSPASVAAYKKHNRSNAKSGTAASKGSA